MTHQELRKGRLEAMERIVSEVNASGFGFQTEKLLARLSVEQGVSRRTAQEYLSCLLITGRIFERDGMLWIPSIFYKWHDIDKEIKVSAPVDKVEEYFKDQETEDKIQEVKQ